MQNDTCVEMIQKTAEFTMPYRILTPIRVWGLYQLFGSCNSVCPGKICMFMWFPGIRIRRPGRDQLLNNNNTGPISLLPPLANYDVRHASLLWTRWLFLVFAISLHFSWPISSPFTTSIWTSCMRLYFSPQHSRWVWGSISTRRLVLHKCGGLYLICHNWCVEIN